MLLAAIHLSGIGTKWPFVDVWLAAHAGVSTISGMAPQWYVFRMAAVREQHGAYRAHTGPDGSFGAEVTSVRQVCLPFAL
jgi:hypothetical protein